MFPLVLIAALYKYSWRVYEGSDLLASNVEYEKDDQLAYDKAKNKINAVIAEHGG